MDNEQPHLDRFEVRGAGAGEISRETIETRAGELARMDGRGTWNEIDLQTATQELGGTWHPSIEPEVVDPALVDLAAWDEPPTSSGTAVPRTPLENESSFSEILVQEGVEEAEHERRLVAEDDLASEEREVESADDAD
ncbi:MAG: hypothetical protein ABIT76_13455 [Chthoniobacterales bacterium]